VPSLFQFQKKRRREFSGKLQLLNLLLLGLTVAFHIVVALMPVAGPLEQRAIHVALFCAIVLWNYPVLRRLSFTRALALDVGLIALVLLCLGYVVVNHEALEMRIPFVTPVSNLELCLGLMAMLMVMEATRRVVGLILPIIVLLVVGYGFLGPAPVGSGSMTIQLLVEQMYLLPDGIFGLPTSVSVKYVVPFVTLATLLTVMGLDDLIVRLSYRLIRRSKVALVQLPVIASALMGSIVGSSTANVVATGSLTIPLLKRFGFSPEFAAAIETCASTGGLFLPPIMGAVAFVMSEYTGIAYMTIAYHALVPALLYYLVVAFTVYLHAQRRQLFKDLNFSLLDQAAGGAQPWRTGQWLFFLPVALLLYLLIIGKSPVFAAPLAILLGLVLSQARPGRGWRGQFFRTWISRSALSAADVAPILVCSGMIVTGIEISGIDTQLVFLIYHYSTSLYLGLVLAALLSIMLGLGMPIIAAYVIQVGIIAPLLTELGLTLLQAHLYLIFFAAVSMMTPPVAVTAYAAAGVAGANPLRTSFLALRLGFAAYIVPFVFALSPALLLVGSGGEIVKALLFTVAGTFALAISFEGWLGRPLGLGRRAAFLVLGLLLLGFYVTGRI